ncbi:MAG: hypothetical protein NTW30_02465 [Candidatus Aenigmarchaeota archaeon]|nr:hypothetical protein [Candidatus Aenigmarchaeota archaeon]
MNKDGRPLLTAVIIYQRIKPEKSGHYSVHLDGVLSVVSSQYGQAELNKFLGLVQPDKFYDRSGKYARNVPLTHPKKQ